MIQLTVLFFGVSIQLIESLISKDLSPEQVVGYCKKNNYNCVGVETIYIRVWKNKKQRGHLYRHLRRKSRKYKKRGTPNTRRGQIPDRVGIDKRPKEVDEKLRFGDMEADTIVGKDHKGAIVTLNDRASGMLKMKKTKHAEQWIPYISTRTADNGKEFTEHKTISENCQIDFYFADPYPPWQRGANENLNGLIRQYFP